MAYDSQEYLDDYYNDGSFPKIHDDIFTLADDVDVDNVMDIGCSIGLLSTRLGEKYNTVIGIEANKKSLERAIKSDNVKYFNLKINKASLSAIKQIIRKYNIEAVFARRVMPELCITEDLDFCKRLSKTFADFGVKYIALEGRIPMSNHAVELWNTELEEKVFEKEYEVIKRHKRCSLLKVK